MPKHVSHCRRHANPIWASMHACSLYRATARLPISCRSREMYCPNGDKQRSGRYAGPAQFGHPRQKFTLRQDVRHCQSVGGTKPEACSYGEPRSKKAAASPDSENRRGVAAHGVNLLLLSIEIASTLRSFRNARKRSVCSSQ